jgi:hypothetical protein
VSTGVTTGGRAGPGTKVGAAPAPRGHRRARGPGRFRLDLSRTPGRLRLLLGVLVLLSLAWGALAAFTAEQYASAASSVAGVREPLSFDAQQIYSHLSDADDTAATAFLAGEPDPPAMRQRYLADIRAAGTETEAATAQGGASLGAAANDLSTLSAGLPIYAGEVETARADNRLGFPLGAAYLREASGLMRGTLLPAANKMYAAENASLGATSARATGRTLAIVTVAVGLGIACALLWASRWLGRRTHRVLNVGVLIAVAACAISLAWLWVACAGERGDLLTAQAQGSAPVEALARADIAALQAHADESLTLIDNSGDDSYQADYVSLQHSLGPGPGRLLTAAQHAAAGSPAAAIVTAAVGQAQGWYRAHARVRSLDDNANHPAAVASVLGSGPGDAGTQFRRFSDDLTAGITTDQAAFYTSAHAGVDAFTGLEPGVIAAALVMAAGCAWGLNRRIAEYR